MANEQGNVGMNKVLNFYDKINGKKNWLFIFIGILVSFVAYLPNLILQKGSVFKYQDQLDGEIFTYIFTAKYIGADISAYQEMFNGINQSGLVMPAPIFSLLYIWLEPFSALLTMHMFISCFAFIGMYLLIKECFDNNIVGLMVGICFAYLPFIGVYGFSIMGIPLLIYAFLNLLKEKKRVISYIIILTYACGSSLTLVGFAVILNLFIVFFFFLVRKQKRKSVQVLKGGLLLGITYLLLNISLIKQVLSISSETMISHKEAIMVYAIPFWNSFKEFFWTGSFHMQSYHAPIVMATIITILCGIVCREKNTEKSKKILKNIGRLFCYNLAVSFFCALFAIKPVVDFRNEIGGVIKYFQLNRISWVTPFTWYFIFALIIMYWIEYIRIRTGGGWKRYIGGLLLLVIVLGISGNALYNSTFKVNVRQMVNPSTSNSITWDKYYNEALFEDINEYIGEPQEEYRVVSMGIYPSMALYNGFYCLDGYSNNYDLNYKEEFRVIIEKELDKNEALRMYFDNWGNRCYFLIDELGQDFFYRKGNDIIVENLELNTKQIYAMGGRYIFSAVQIQNYEKSNLLFEKYFESEESSIGIYLYKIME